MTKEPLLSITPIHTWDEMVDLRGRWNQLAGENPFRRWEWLANWWKHLGSPHDLFVLLARDRDNQIVGLAPWYREQQGPGRRVISFLGGGKACSDHLSLLCDRQHLESVPAAIAHWLIEQHQTTDVMTRWDSIEFVGIDEDDASLDAFMQHFADSDYTVYRRSGLQTWEVSLPTDWSDYVKSLSKSSRRRVKRAIERVDDDPRIQMQRFSEPADFDYAWSILVDLHQRRRHSLGQPGCFDFPGFNNFLQQATRGLMADGRSQLDVVLLDGKPLAIECILLGENHVYVYQSGMDPAGLEERPGWLTFASGIRNAINNQRRTYDFLRGDESYKAHWKAVPKSTLDVRIVAPHPIAQLRHQAWLATRNVKDWLHQKLSTPSSST